MALIGFTLSNARRFYLSMGNPLGVKGLTTWKAKMSPFKVLVNSKAKSILAFNASIHNNNNYYYWKKSSNHQTIIHKFIFCSYKIKNCTGEILNDHLSIKLVCKLIYEDWGSWVNLDEKAS